MSRRIGPVALIAALAAAWPLTAAAEDQPPKPAAGPEAPAPAPDNVDLSIGGGVVFSPRPYVGASSNIIPIPVVNVRYKSFFVEGIRGGYQFIKSGQLTGNAYLQANFEGLESTDSPYLSGMRDRSMSADAGAELVYRARPVGFRVNVLSDVLGRNGGQEGHHGRAARPWFVPPRRYRPQVGQLHAR